MANQAAVTGGATRSINTSGGLAGGQFGYLYQAGPAIFGVEAGFDWSGLRGSTHNGPTTYPVNPGSTFAWNVQAKQDWLFTFLGRVGVDAGNWYPYLTGGLRSPIKATRPTLSIPSNRPIIPSHSATPRPALLSVPAPRSVWRIIGCCAANISTWNSTASAAMD